MNRIIVAAGILAALSGWAQASSEFAKYPAAGAVATCKDLDFSSYFRAQDHQKHLIRDNPERTRPNFGGKYLLLKQELMIETLWLIADCETGKFYHETLTGLADFRPDSLLVILSKPKSDELPRYELWKGGDWTRVDGPEAKPASPPPPSEAHSSPASVAAVYAGLFRKYAESPIESCRDLDYDSFFRAQGSKNNLQKLNPERSKPNFAGRYLLLQNDVLFERYWLIADCTTGKFAKEIIKGSTLEFRPDSSLLLVRFSSEFPRLNVWRDQRFVELLNPVRTGKQEVENDVLDQDARDLMEAVGIPPKESRGAFENLRCVGQNCTVRRFPDPKPQALTAEQARVAEAVLKKWGGEFTDSSATGYSIESGKCQRKKSYPVCEIKLSR